MRYNQREEWEKPPNESIVPCNVFDADGVLVDKFIESLDTETGMVEVQDHDLQEPDDDKPPTHIEFFKPPLTVKKQLDRDSAE